jgi:hypothetical protein
MYISSLSKYMYKPFHNKPPPHAHTHTHFSVLLHALAHTLKQQQEEENPSGIASTATTNSVPLPALRMSAKEINADPARFFGGSG